MGTHLKATRFDNPNLVVTAQHHTVAFTSWIYPLYYPHHVQPSNPSTALTQPQQHPSTNLFSPIPFHSSNLIPLQQYPEPNPTLLCYPAFIHSSIKEKKKERKEDR